MCWVCLKCFISRNAKKRRIYAAEVEEGESSDETEVNRQQASVDTELTDLSKFKPERASSGEQRPLAYTNQAPLAGDIHTKPLSPVQKQATRIVHQDNLMLPGY